MEIREIVSYFLNNDTNNLEVTFRTIEDSDDVIRIDNLDFSLTEEYGFDLIEENFDFFSNETDDDFEIDEESEIELNEDDLLEFLNEYYTIHPEYFPESQVF